MGQIRESLVMSDGGQQDYIDSISNLMAGLNPDNRESFGLTLQGYSVPELQIIAQDLKDSPLKRSLSATFQRSVQRIEAARRLADAAQT